MFIILTYQYDTPDIAGSQIPEHWGCAKASTQMTLLALLKLVM